MKIFSGRNFISSAVSIALSVVFVASVTFASTTISTDIATGGTLTVGGLSTLSGQLQASSTALFGGAVTAYKGLTVGSGTVANVLDGTILFQAQTSDPTGVTEGTLYYNSTSKVLRLFDGTAWFTTGTTTSGISLSGKRLQLADLTTYLAIGTSTPLASVPAVVTIQATTTTSVPLVLAGIKSQSGNLFSIRDDSNTKLLYVTSAGALFGSSTLQVDGAVVTYGAVTLGDASTDAITLTGNASTTNALTVGGNFYIGGYATTTGATGATQIGGNLSVNGFATTTASTGAFDTKGTVSVNGFATTTASTGNFGTLGKIGVGTTTPTTLSISAEGTATTTIAAFSSGALKGGCLQLQGTNGLLYRMYVGATGLATTSQSGTTGSFIAVWEPGSCK